jgi:hypothetical protein
MALLHMKLPYFRMHFAMLDQIRNAMENARINFSIISDANVYYLVVLHKPADPNLLLQHRTADYLFRTLHCPNQS